MMEDDLMEEVDEVMEEVAKKEEVASGRKKGVSVRGSKGSKVKEAETSRRGRTLVSLPKETVEGRGGRRERIATPVKESSEPPTTEEEEIPPPVQLDQPAQAPAVATVAQEGEEEPVEALTMEAPKVLPVQVLAAEVRVSESLASTDRASASPPCEVNIIIIIIIIIIMTNLNNISILMIN